MGDVVAVAASYIQSVFGVALFHSHERKLFRQVVIFTRAHMDTYRRCKEGNRNVCFANKSLYFI